MLVLVINEVIAVYTAPDRVDDSKPNAMIVRKLYVDPIVNLGMPSFIF